MRVQPKKIMCAVDFSNFTDAILAYSVALCKKFHAKLFLVHIVMDVNVSFVNSGIVFDRARLQEEHIRNAQQLLGAMAFGLTIAKVYLLNR